MTEKQTVIQGDVVRLPDGRVGVFVGFLPMNGCRVWLGDGTEVWSRDVDLVKSKRELDQEVALVELVNPMSESEKRRLVLRALPPPS